MKTRYVADGQQMLRADREVRVPLSAEVERRLLAQFEDSLREADVVVLSDYAKGVLSERVTRAAIKAAFDAHKPVIVDPKAKDLGKYRGATVLTPNRLELQTACGFECATDETVESAARRFLDDDVCAAMVVTRGKDGMSVVAKDAAAVHLRTMARQVFDVSVPATPPWPRCPWDWRRGRISWRPPRWLIWPRESSLENWGPPSSPCPS